MKSQPQLIMLYGAVGAGKTTLAERYARSVPMTLCLENDRIISMISGWYDHEPEARELVFNYAQPIIDLHLAAGYDVILPYLLTDHEHAAVFENIAIKQGAIYKEVVLHISKETSVRRTLTRGTWGEPDAPPVTEGDRPVIEDLFDRQAAALEHRPKISVVQSVDNDPDATYEALRQAIDKAKAPGDLRELG